MATRFILFCALGASIALSISCQPRKSELQQLAETEPAATQADQAELEQR
jgi:hypothetical protein